MDIINFLRTHTWSKLSGRLAIGSTIKMANIDNEGYNILNCGPIQLVADVRKDDTCVAITKPGLQGIEELYCGDGFDCLKTVVLARLIELRDYLSSVKDVEGAFIYAETFLRSK